MAEIIAFFTAGDLPSPGLAQAPQITIRQVDIQLDVVMAQAMTDLGNGFYGYTFAPGVNFDYTITIDGDPTASGQVDDRYQVETLSGQEEANAERVEKIDKRQRNKKSLSETTGIHEILEDDGLTVFERTQAYSDDNFTTPYDGSKAVQSEEPI